MKIVIQRVKESSVSISGQVVGKVGQGVYVLTGIEPTDTEKELDWMAGKLANLRIFEDEAGKMNLSLLDIRGGALIISQFTLLADCVKGRRPSFIGAGNPETAEKLYLKFLDKVAALGVPVAHGVFGADMQVYIHNDGPVTFVLESPK
ncbi:MAG: D-tyrosyl-tRNA(Tyr) deacylase [Alphaproteobacteria bacterium]|nr:D-tyrosyl-tRNA(Tyr) deacylase [Alphaproteobacteria bacterium]